MIAQLSLLFKNIAVKCVVKKLFGKCRIVLVLIKYYLEECR